MLLPWMEGLAGTQRGKALRFEMAWHGSPLRPKPVDVAAGGSEICRVVEDHGSMGTSPGHEVRAGGATDRLLAVRVLEHQRRRHERVDVGRLHLRLAVAPELRPEVVHDEVEHVFHGFRSHDLSVPHRCRWGLSNKSATLFFDPPVAGVQLEDAALEPPGYRGASTRALDEREHPSGARSGSADQDVPVEVSLRNPEPDPCAGSRFRTQGAIGVPVDEL